MCIRGTALLGNNHGFRENFGLLSGEINIHFTSIPKNKNDDPELPDLLSVHFSYSYVLEEFHSDTAGLR